MAYDVFFDIEGIPGESLDSKFKDKIEVFSFSFCERQAGTFAYGSGGGAGKVDFSSLKFTKATDAATHLLFLHCAEGRHIPKATLFVRKAGGGQQDFFKIALTDLIVSSFTLTGSPASDYTKPLEDVELQFSTMKVSYSKQKQDGSQEAFKDAGWSIKENKKL